MGRKSSAKQLKTAISRIVTDSRLPGEAKDADSSHLFQIYRGFACNEASAEFRQSLLDGMGWGDAKQQLFALLDAELAPGREHYNALLQRPDDLEDILLAGAAKARAIAQPFLAELREAVGLQSFRNQGASSAAKVKKSASAARVVSARDSDGQFRFRLRNSAGDVLLTSIAFADGKSAGLAAKAMMVGSDDWRRDDSSCALWQAGVLVAECEVALADAAVIALAELRALED